MLTELQTASPNGHNGYQQQPSPGHMSGNRSPNMAVHTGHSMSTSPGPISNTNSNSLSGGGGGGSRPNLKVVIPSPSGSNLHQQGQQQQQQQQHNSRTSNATLSTPEVSLATPSNPGLPAYPSALPSTFQHSDFQLSADLTGMSGFNHAAGMLSGSWSTGPLPVSASNLRYGQRLARPPPSHLASGGGGASHVTIKSEPMSPPRDSHTPSSHHSLVSGHSHLSPQGSSSDSQTGNAECDSGQAAKRQRVDGWSS
ncbi:PREDICTED: myocyte-specific enhancer factor 2A-like [Priapulus caudatus]|uniref:Myocyte-specific enhancer factor 2A-like n=1 Tax=Priapulus caudatus TaxID=37621 RepID=A0ABM1F2V1_PRICU|nr:PREDICTED: myocyte-specific enhancer factor 2A-like [Priapulus caudatus]